MASTVKHLRSSTANKRPTASGLADGQLGINTASGTPGVFFKDSAGTVVKVGPAHVGSSAPNVSPAGSAGNSLGELWVNNSTTINGLNYYTGSAFVNLTPSGTTTVAGLIELATDAETQTGTDTIRAVTPSGLQSKISNSISTTSSTTIASATAVKTAYDLANAALPKAGGRITGNLEIGPAGSLSFEGSSDDGFETTFAVVNPTADRTITFPNVTGNVVTTGDSGTVTGTMIAATTITNAEISASAAIALSKLATGALPTGITVSSGNIVDGTITNADINASAAIVDTKLATISTAGKVSNSATTATNANTASAIVARDASGNFTAGTITAALTGAASSNVLKAGDTMTGALVVPRASASTPSLTFTGDLSTGIFSPGADQVSISTNGVSRLQVGGNICGVGAADAATAGLEVGPGATGNRIAYLDLIGDTTYADHGLRLIRAGDGANSSGSLINRGTGELKLVSQEAGAITFLTTNAERARIDSAGRLLVGTSTSVNDTFGASRLQVSGTDGNIASMGRYSADAFAPIIYLRKSRGSLGAQGIVSSGDNLGALIWTGSDGAGFIQGAVIAAEVDGTPGANDMPGRLVFSTTSDGAASPTERMRIDSQGRVGVGTASPVVRFQVSESSAGEVEVARFRIEGQTNNPMLRVFADEADNTVTLDTSGSTVGTELVFKEGGAEAMRIDRSGRLLVGPAGSSIATAGIAGGLQLHNTANANGAQFSIVRFNNDTGAGTLILGKSKSATVSPGTAVVGNDSLGNIIFIGDDGTDLGSSGASITAFVDGTPGANDMPGRLVFSTTTDGNSSPTERMRIASSGNVGIGTTSTNSRLSVIGSNTISSQANVAALIGAGIDSDLLLGSLNGNSPFVASQGAYPLLFLTNANERARIDSAGRLLIGTSTSVNTLAGIGSTLQVSEGGGVAASLLRSTNDTSGANLVFRKTRSTSPTGVTVVQNGDTLGRLVWMATDGTNPIETARITAEVDGTPGANDMPGRLVFSTTADGAASPTERMRITSAGNVGIGTTSPSTALQVNGTVTATTFSGALNGNASTVTTNANLTGHITSVGNATVLGSFTSADLAGALTDETGTGANVFATSPTLVTPVLGVATGTSFNGITGLSSTNPAALGAVAVGTGTTTARADHVHPTTGLGLTSGTLAQFASTTSSQLAGVISDETGSGALVFATSPTLVTPALGTPSSGNLANCTSINATNISSGTLAEARLPFQPIQQGGGTSQGTNKLYIGWSAGNVLRLQVDTTDFGATWPIGVSGNAATVTTNANLTGDITSVGNATSIASGVIVNADINASAAIADTKLATISTAGKVSGTAITSGDIDTSGDLEITNLAPNLRLTESDGTATHSQTTLIRSNDQFLLQTRDSAGTTVSSDYAIPANASGATDHIWRIQNTEAMRIDSSGNVGIGTTSPDAPLHVAGLTRLNSTDTPATSTTSAIARTTASNNDGNVGLESVATNTNTRHHISFVNPNGIVGSISTNGSATAYNTSSDYRLKENIVPLTGAIDRLQQIPVHRFNFIADPDTVVDGFIAHEAAAVVPECVTGEKDQVDENDKPIYQGIDQSKIVPLLTAALQEALQKIEDLEARLTAANL